MRPTIDIVKCLLNVNLKTFLLGNLSFGLDMEDDVHVSIYVCSSLVLKNWYLLYTPFLFLFPAKLARLKQAKEEGDKDIAEFRAQIEHEFQRKVAEVSVTTK